MTNSPHYREAERIIEKAETINQAAAIKYINRENNSEQWLNMVLPEAIEARNEVIASGKYPYQSDVVRVLLSKLDISATASTLSRTSNVVYGSTQYLRAKETIELYKKMSDNGYISIHDITEDMHGKTALLNSAQTHDLLTIKKNDEKVRLYIKNNRIGYQKLRMRSRYYAVSIDMDLFVKIIA